MKKMLRMLCVILTGSLILSSCSLWNSDHKNEKESSASRELQSFYYSYASAGQRSIEYSVYFENGKTIFYAENSSTDQDLMCEVDSSVLDDLYQIIVDNNIESWNENSGTESTKMDIDRFNLSVQYSSGSEIVGERYTGNFPENFDAVHEKIVKYFVKLEQQYAGSVLIPDIKSFSYSYESNAGDKYEYFVYKTDGETYFEAFESEGEGLRISCEVDNSVLSDLNEIINEVDVKSWGYFNNSDDQFSDGYSYLFSVEFFSGELSRDKSLYAKGNKQFPESYDVMHENIVQYFESLLQQYSENDPVAMPEQDLVSFTYSFGSYFGGFSGFEIYKENGNSYLKVTGGNSNAINVLCKIDESVWGDLKRIISFNDLSSWNGFEGNNSDVMDGYSFGLSIKYSDGSEISGGAYMVFPENYDAVHHRLCYYLDNLVQHAVGEEFNSVTELDMTSFSYSFVEEGIGDINYYLATENGISKLNVYSVGSENHYNHSYLVDNTTLKNLQNIISDTKMYQYVGYNERSFEQNYFTVVVTYKSLTFSTASDFDYEPFPANYEVHEKLKMFFDNFVLQNSPIEKE